MRYIVTLSFIIYLHTYFLIFVSDQKLIKYKIIYSRYFKKNIYNFPRHRIQIF